MKQEYIDFLNQCNKAYSEGIFAIYDKEYLVQLFPEFESEFINESVEIVDSVYDKLYYHLKSLYPNDNYFNKLTSVNLGWGIDVNLEYPAGSLKECKANGDIEKWIEKRSKESNYICTEKLDGLSLILTYDNGNLISASTRGNGVVGKDVLRHIITLSCVPQSINIKEKLVIRGECICPKSNLNKMLLDFQNETGKEYKNGRNTIAGWLNNKNTIKAGSKNIHVVCYDIMNKSISLSKKLQLLKDCGLLVASFNKYKSDDITTDNMIKEFTNIKENSKYECDGVVITEDLDLNVQYETGTYNPTHSRKFKTLSNLETAESEIIDINWQISKHRKFTPVLVINPVKLAGAEINNVSGFNYKQVIDNGWGIGAKVLIKRSGDVIPKVEQTISRSNNIILPTGSLDYKGVDIYLNELDTSKDFDIRVEQIVSFASDLDIEQCGPGNVISILQHYYETKDIILSVVEFINIPESIFRKVIGVNGGKLYQSIQDKLYNIEEYKFFGALNIFGAGISATILKRIEKKYGRLDVTADQLREISGFGEARIKQIIQNMDNYYKARSAYLKQNRTFKKVEIDNTANSEDTYKVVFTGFRSDELKTLFEKAGGVVVDSFTKDINLVVAKTLETKSSKVIKAEKLGIKVISKEQAMARLVNFKD